uniref:Uncharacterized protein n=1 Tax=Sphaerodactylus townsendi TaxID=933632 RepID=A0ACB8FHK0_9SAUR
MDLDRSGASSPDAWEEVEKRRLDERLGEARRSSSPPSVVLPPCLWAAESVGRVPVATVLPGAPVPVAALLCLLLLEEPPDRLRSSSSRLSETSRFWRRAPSPNSQPAERLPEWEGGCLLDDLVPLAVALANDSLRGEKERAAILEFSQAPC